MSPTILLLLALGLGLAGWLAARARAYGFKREVGSARLAALPNYYAWYVALWVLIPIVVFIAVWSFIAPQMVTSSVLASPAAANLPEFGFLRNTMLNEAMAVATGQGQSIAPGRWRREAELAVRSGLEAAHLLAVRRRHHQIGALRAPAADVEAIAGNGFASHLGK